MPALNYFYFMNLYAQLHTPFLPIIPISTKCKQNRFNWVLITAIAVIIIIGLFPFFYLRKRGKYTRKKPARKKSVSLRKEAPRQSAEVSAQQSSSPVEASQSAPPSARPEEQLQREVDAA
jgi:FtsZ-interacting cell division protein ZipA